MLTYTNIENPKWTSADKVAIDCDVYFDEIPGATPFTANTSDTAAHSQAIFAALVAGEFGEIAEYVGPQVANDSAFPTPPSGQIPVVTF